MRVFRMCVSVCVCMCLRIACGLCFMSVQALAKEVGKYNIRFNVVCPGVVVPSTDHYGKYSMWNEMKVC